MTGSVFTEKIRAEELLRLKFQSYICSKMKIIKLFQTFSLENL